MQFLEISWDFGILGFSKILGFFQRFFVIFDEVYEDFQSNLPLDETKLSQIVVTGAGKAAQRGAICPGTPVKGGPK
jgi:hypothetical protein